MNQEKNPSFNIGQKILDSRYEISEFIVFGSNSEIYIIKNDDQSFILKYYPWKIIKKQRQSKVVKIRKRIENEIQYHSSLNHPNIIKIFECKREEDQIFLIVELAHGQKISESSNSLNEKGKTIYDCFELLDFYHKTGQHLTIDQIRNYFRQIVSAVKYIHEQGLIHGDIKTENILLSDSKKVKLADFDWTRQVKQIVNSFDLHDPYEGGGTLFYCPPELLILENLDYYSWNKYFYSQSTDIWSLGLVFYEFLTNGRFLYICSPVSINPICSEVDKNWRELSYKIVHQHYLDHIKYDAIDFKSNVIPEARDLVCKMLCPDPKKRIDIQAIESHPFLKI